MKSNKIDKILAWVFGAVTIYTAIVLIVGLLLHPLDSWNTIYLVVMLLNGIVLTASSIREGWRN